MNMITVDPDSATAIPGLPTMMAGSMKPMRMPPAMISPTRANSPFQRATASTATVNSAARTKSTGSRLMPLNA